MGDLQSAKLRNVGLFGHGGTGKTTLAEALLHVAKALERRGKVEEGSSFFDVEPEEIHRHISLSLSFGHLDHRDHRVTLINTPGYLDFYSEALVGLELSDGAVVVVDATSGVQVGTEIIVKELVRRNLPFVFFVTKLDRENTDFFSTVASLTAEFGPSVLPAVHAGPETVHDLLAKDPDADPVKEALRGRLVEAAVEGDDEVLGRYLDGEDISREDLMTAFSKAVRSGRCHPVFGGSALSEDGLSPLLDAMVELLPPPEVSGPDLAVRVLKTTADPFVGRLNLFKVMGGSLTADQHLHNLNRNREERFGQIYLLNGKTKEPVHELLAGQIGAVAKLQETSTWDTLVPPGKHQRLFPALVFGPPPFKMAIAPRTAGDEEKLGAALARLAEEDPSISVEHPEGARTLVIAGSGELHLEVLKERLKRKFGVQVDLSMPPVAYQETLRGTVKAEGRHKKQSGGHGQFGHVWLEVGPSDKPFEFVDKIFGGSVSLSYRPAVEKGIREAMAEGILAGYPVTGVRVVLYDGSEHPVDSSEMAFKIAGSMAFKKAAETARPVLLEPVMEVTVSCPEGLTGEVIGDLNKKRGKIVGMEASGGEAQVRAHVPEAELLRYAIDLRSLSGGRGRFSQAFFGYEEVPAHVAAQVIAERKKATG